MTSPTVLMYVPAAATPTLYTAEATTRAVVMTVLPLLAFVIPIVGRQPQNAQQQRQEVQQQQAKLRVCTDEDCVQQGAYQTMAKLKKRAKGKKVQVHGLDTRSLHN